MFYMEKRVGGERAIDLDGHVVDVQGTDNLVD